MASFVMLVAVVVVVVAVVVVVVVVVAVTVVINSSEVWNVALHPRRYSMWRRSFIYYIYSHFEGAPI